MEPRRTSSSNSELPVNLEHENLSPERTAELADDAKQEEYRQAFLLQQQRRNCPGCGDDGSLF
jgi:hypothetical protein